VIPLLSITLAVHSQGGKFSKSRGTGVFGNDAKDTGIPVEVSLSSLTTVPLPLLLSVQVLLHGIMTQHSLGQLNQPL
jgi:hypothetical protein